MLRSLLNAVMERRARELTTQIGGWLPTAGPMKVLDLGSGTGHLSACLERELRLTMVTADVSDIHVVGQPPVLIADGRPLPFEDGSFSAALLVFVLAYPNDPVHVLMEVARVTRGPIVLIQSLYSDRLGYVWLRTRELLWTFMGFHVSRAIGYVPADAQFTMRSLRFYSAPQLTRELTAAGLRVRSRWERPQFVGDSLVVAGCLLECDD